MKNILIILLLISFNISYSQRHEIKRYRYYVEPYYIMDVCKNGMCKHAVWHCSAGYKKVYFWNGSKWDSKKMISAYYWYTWSIYRKKYKNTKH